MVTHPRKIVQSGYDRLGEAYREYFAPLHREHYGRWIDELRRRIPCGGLAVELGCGDGIPVGRELVRHCRYRGVDLSPVQIRLARRNVPGGEFAVADMIEVDLTPRSVDAVIALYSIVHVPFEEHAPLFRRVASGLKDGGIFMAVVGAGRWTGTTDHWIRPGITMYWSHGSGDDYQTLAVDAGFEVLDRSFVAERDVGHTYLLMKKQAGSVG